MPRDDASESGARPSKKDATHSDASESETRRSKSDVMPRKGEGGNAEQEGSDV